MKKITIVLAAVVALVACTPGERDYDTVMGEIKTKKGEIKVLEEELAALDTTDKDDVLPSVYITQVQSKTFTSFVEVHGVVQSDKNVVVMPEFNGVLKSVSIREGSMVKKGQRLATVDTEILRKNLAEIKTRLVLADSLFNKQKRLWESEVGSEIQYLEAKNNKEALENSISTLNSQISKAVIVSPIDGKVNEVYPNLGEMVSPATPFARIVNTKEVYIDSDVSEALFNKVASGDEVRVRFPYQNDTITSKVEYKGNFINPNNRTFKVHVALADKSLPPNLLTVIRLKDVDLENVITVPSNVIQNDGKRDFVYTTDEKTATKVFITTGASYKNETVVSGLKAGDKIVIEGHKKLVDKGELKVEKK